MSHELTVARREAAKAIRLSEAARAAPKLGDLRVWWIPQVPGKPFHVSVASPKEARFVLAILGEYDLFQLANKIKPDYCNAGGLQVYVDDEGVPEWVEWDDEDGYGIDETELTS